eukprot:3435560-Amphidinium_carterae.1
MAPKAKAKGKAKAKAKGKAKAAPQRAALPRCLPRLPVRGAVGGQQLPGQAEPWIIMDVWQEGCATASQIHAGHLVELSVKSPGGRSMGTMIVQVVAPHPVDGQGMGMEVKNCGASSQRLQAWCTEAEQAGGFLVHLCRLGACPFEGGDRVILHVRSWRLRNPLGLREAWYVAPREELPELPHLRGAGQQAVGQAAPGGEEQALLHRFEELRDGVAATAGAEQQLARAELASALRVAEEDGVGRAAGAGAPGLAQRVLSREQERLQDGKRKGKKRRRRSRSRSSSGSGSDGEELEKGGADRLAKLAERRPGYLARAALKKMQEYLSLREEDGPFQKKDVMRPIVTTFLTTALLPSTDISLRNTRELTTIAR